MAPNTHIACFFLLVYAPSVENASLKTRLSEPLLFRGLPKALTASFLDLARLSRPSSNILVTTGNQNENKFYLPKLFVC